MEIHSIESLQEICIRKIKLNFCSLYSQFSFRDKIVQLDLYSLDKLLSNLGSALIKEFLVNIEKTKQDHPYISEILEPYWKQLCFLRFKADSASVSKESIENNNNVSWKKCFYKLERYYNEKLSRSCIKMELDSKRQLEQRRVSKRLDYIPLERSSVNKKKKIDNSSSCPSLFRPNQSTKRAFQKLVKQTKQVSQLSNSRKMMK